MKNNRLFAFFPIAFSFLMLPTFSKSENNSIPKNAVELSEGIYVSKKPGFYPQKQKLTFYTDDNILLYYSLNYDNTDIQKMTLYKEPFYVDKITDKKKENYPCSTAVDAILEKDKEGKCVSDDYINHIQKTGNYVFYDKQPVVKIKAVDKDTKEVLFSRSLTYWIEDDILKDLDIPVISLSLPYSDFIGEEHGFYNKIREDIATRVDMEYFDKEYQESFYRNSQIKLGGNWTLGYPQRTFNLNFNKDENGKKNKKVKEHVFQERRKQGNQEERLTGLTRFRLHNGGNAFETSSRINDAVLQRLMENSFASTTAYRPCIVYINGEYWGLMSLREHYKDTYFENNYDIDKDHILTYDLKGIFQLDDGNKTIGQEKLEAFNDYIDTYDFKEETNYQIFLKDYFDVDSFIDVVLAQAYSGNWDFIGNYNNLKMWSTTSKSNENAYEDGRFHFALHDADFAFMSNQNPLYLNHPQSYSKFPLMRNLLRNQSFRNRLYSRSMELTNTLLSPYQAMDIFNSMMNERKKYQNPSSLRWGKSKEQLSDYPKEIDDVFAFFEKKSKTFPSEIKNILCMYGGVE